MRGLPALTLLSVVRRPWTEGTFHLGQLMQIMHEKQGHLDKKLAVYLNESWFAAVHLGRTFCVRAGLQIVNLGIRHTIMVEHGVCMESLGMWSSARMGWAPLSPPELSHTGPLLYVMSLSSKQEFAVLQADEPGEPSGIIINFLL